ncbi:hypothetical protein AGMMS49992_12120 [Clostridia bacterium]|nr:hypothetical protein AGMMS49992_12120 [Clostridia bacterium]
MSVGRMRSFIRIGESEIVKDEEGYSSTQDKTVAVVRAYKESRHGNESWKNRAAFTEATSLFRFRKIPGATITTSNYILCDADRYHIVSVEDVRDRGMYTECMTDIIQPSVR